MTVVDVPIVEESRTRYLTYALSVVSNRALPDVRDGLKPVQRRILYAMASNLHLYPERAHRKSAAVVGEVLARYHPHGDAACYEAMVRMAQEFTFRYPLVDGQGNFGSLDGDSAAAYRYTEARLTRFAMEVVGDIGEGTVPERDNFDQTLKEPAVLPTRIPQLLVNGASGIAVGMATAIPPHNLREVIEALLLLIEDEEVPDSKLFQAIKAPDFPTGCLIVNSRAELKNIYVTGRGPIKMRANYQLEKLPRGKDQIIVTSIPYNVDKSSLVEKIADLIIAKKIPQLTDVRDESTDKVRVALELASGADPEAAMAFLYKHTPLQTNFNVNLTALTPTDNPLSGRPVQLSLRQALEYFVQFRLQVTRAKLEFERAHLEKRIHLLQGLVKIFDVIPEIISIVRKSDGRADGAARIQKRFGLSSEQALFIVDLRIYQLSKTSIDEIEAELKEKTDRVNEINRILGSKKALKNVVAVDLQRISEMYGDARRSKIVYDTEEKKFEAEAYVKEEKAQIIVTKDGWIKRLGEGGDPENTRLRPGDQLFFAKACSTLETLALFTNFGNVFAIRVVEVTATSGFGEPVQKLFRFQDGEQIVGCLVLAKENSRAEDGESRLLLFSKQGSGFRTRLDLLQDTKKTGKRLMKLSAGDVLAGICLIEQKNLLLVSSQGYGLLVSAGEIPALAGVGKGVRLQKLPKDDFLCCVASVEKGKNIVVEVQNSQQREIVTKELELSSRAKRGNKIVKRGGPVVRLIRVGDVVAG